ncbi:MAG: DUF192 domain-containing protein [Alphaproteobacteria bacterium]|nr:DUF192 domain-containing protein [Alphaproteobacteria bacterium]
MKILKILLVVLIVLVLAVAVYIKFFRLKELPIYTENGIISYRVEIAKTDEQQQKGLMYRNKLAPQTGMIFLFNPIRIAYMWMKNTFIPLDMIFFDRFGRIVAIHKHANPQDETIISSKIPVAGVLEINADETDNNQIRVGDRLILNNF